MVPFAPGGSADLVARVLGQKLTESWGQQVIVDNRPGGSGMIGNELVAKSAPDGYTLTVGTMGPFSVNQTLFEQGGRFKRPTLWLYGRHDPFYSITHSRENFAAFQKAGGQGSFLEFDVPGGYGHDVIRHPQLWSAPIGNYLSSLAEDKQ